MMQFLEIADVLFYFHTLLSKSNKTNCFLLEPFPYQSLKTCTCEESQVNGCCFPKNCIGVHVYVCICFWLTGLSRIAEVTLASSSLGANCPRLSSFNWFPEPAVAKASSEK